MSCDTDRTCSRAERRLLHNRAVADNASTSIFGATVLMAQPARRNRYWDERPYQRGGN
jgi:hypothetical protein